MSPSNARLLRLVNLANEASSDKRRELIEEVADLFIDDSGVMSSREAGLADEILTKVAHDVEMKVRTGLAERFASSASAPPTLLRMLANDEIEVAAPILEESRALNETDLIGVVRSKGQAHMMVVTRREEIPEAVSDVLVERGDDSVLVNLVRNVGAQISRGGMQTLVARSENSSTSPWVTVPLGVGQGHMSYEAG